MLVDVGLDDQFLDAQLKPELLEEAARAVGQKVSVRRHPGHDHSYFFVSSFMEDHVRFHADALARKAASLGETSDAPVAGVYATYDADGAMTFVGYRRDVLAAVRAHVERNGADATGVRVAAFANKAMATRANLRAESDRWIGEWVEANGGEEASIPKGNLAVNAADWTLVSESWPNEGAATVAGAGPHVPTVSNNFTIIFVFWRSCVCFVGIDNQY